MDNIERLKEMAINAISGHLTINEPVYELGKALESTCEEVERLEPFEQEAIDARETIQEQADTISELKQDVKDFAEKVAGI